MIFNLTIFIFTTLLTFYVLKYKKNNYTKIVVLLLYILFFLKLTEYTIYGLTLQFEKIPIEFSTVTYFIFSASIIFNITKLKPFATFAAFLSGTGYLLSFIFLGKSFFENLGFYSAFMAYANHSILFMTSLLYMRLNLFAKSSKLFFIMMSLLYVSYYIIVNHFIMFNDPNIFIRMLFGGLVLKQILQTNNITQFQYIIYFLVIGIIYYFSIHVFYKINQTLFMNKKGYLYEYSI